MKPLHNLYLRIGLLILTVFIWVMMLDQPFSATLNLLIITGGTGLVFPIVWLVRKMLDREPTTDHAVWITTFVHYALIILFGSAIIRAVLTYDDWSGWILPVPSGIALFLVVIFGLAALLSVLNLAVKGLGAPFAIALSQKLSVDWMYAWTRNPMVLSTLAFLLALGIWYQSLLFVAWVLLLVSPALIFFVKRYEERELAIRFGPSYLDYKSRTPMLFPRKPGKRGGKP